ncbi:peroxiredoxin [Lactobacillus sp. W8092]|nr:peroxiredoxin [Lactobacillus sp. W8092]
MKIQRHGQDFCELNDYPLVGQKFPEFQVLDSQQNPVTLASLLTKPLLISVVPNIETSVCALQTKHFNEVVDQFSQCNFVTISTNTPEQQQNWCAAANVTRMQLLSDEQFNFGHQTNLLMGDSKLLARSVWLLQTDGQIIYSEIPAEMTDEPGYEPVLAQIKQL